MGYILSVGNNPAQAKLTCGTDGTQAKLAEAGTKFNETMKKGVLDETKTD